MPAPDIILRKVDQFRTNREQYKSLAYKETPVRVDFINPFFEALGWDVANSAGVPEHQRDVIHEYTLGPQAPDYCFRIGKQRKFFVEAKKPSVDLSASLGAAYQLRHYAWNAHLPVSILTDFEEFVVYDCRVRPKDGDRPDAARLLYFDYEQYPEKWDQIADLFHRFSVRNGSLDQFVKEAKERRETKTVDDAFLEELQTWRELLAKGIALRNPSLSQRELNFAVQRTIDRIVFLRIAEDRGIEPREQLKKVADGVNLYARLIPLFNQADQKYNSGLFHFGSEKGRATTPDAWTLNLALDDKVLKTILSRLYYPHSPYEFSAMPADILGQVYERFLGSVIRLTAGHHAKVEEKPEVRKAGGVYYTPTYIVEYIVQNTVGKLLEGKTPDQVSELRILDMACGSGSFLLGAYQYLQDWHRDYYLEKGTKTERKRLFEAAGGEWRLTTDEKKRILLNNIYGVDIDPQAVEVTKLSLMLKVLEGESEETLKAQLELFKARALPDLGSNIKCGNSLIGPDFYSGQQLGLLNEEEHYRINAFDWNAEFPQVMKGEGLFLWLVTFVTHESRISARMVEYGADKGLKPLVFNAEDQTFIASRIAEALRKYQIRAASFNVLPDHVHMVVAAKDEDELHEMVRKIKGFTSHEYKQKYPKGNHEPVWAQKFNRRCLEGEGEAVQAIEYVRNNHYKHAERWGEKIIETWDKGLKPLVLSVCISPEDKGFKPLVQRCGGFDAVIGNPPYIRIQAMKEWAPVEVELYKERYRSARKGNYDIYVVFAEKGLSLLRDGGRLGYILPHKFMNAQYGEGLRDILSKGRHLARVVHFGDKQIFEQATTYTCLMFLDKTPAEAVDVVKVADLDTWKATGEGEHGTVKANTLSASEWNFVIGKGGGLFDRLSAMPVKLGDVAERISQGPITSADTIYLFKEHEQNTPDFMRVRSKELDQWFEIETGILRPVIRSGSISRYVAKTTAYILFPYEVSDNQARLFSTRELKEQFPLAWNYLSLNKKMLEGREKGKFKDAEWYRFGRNQNLGMWQQPKIMVPYMIANLAAYYDRSDNYYFINVTTGGYGITCKESLGNYHYFCGLLNSRLLDFFLKQVSTNFHGGYFAANKQFIEGLPIRPIDFADKRDKARHDKMVELVQSMLDLHKRKDAARLDDEKKRIERQIAATDREIDERVYELYGLTKEERAIVEGEK